MTTIEVELEIPAPDRHDRPCRAKSTPLACRHLRRFHVVLDGRTAGTFMTDDRGSLDMELQDGKVPASPQDI
jgi:hypothetical protein